MTCRQLWKELINRKLPLNSGSHPCHWVAWLRSTEEVKEQQGLITLVWKQGSNEVIFHSLTSVMHPIQDVHVPL